MIRVDQVERMSGGQLVQHYLTSSYCYYWLDINTMTDHAFDRLVVRLREMFHTINHPHKHVINFADLEGSTCLLPRSAFPTIVLAFGNLAMRHEGTRFLEQELDKHLGPYKPAPPRIMRRPAPAPVASPAAPARTRIMRTPLKK